MGSDHPVPDLGALPQCRMCRAPAPSLLLDLGPQPISSHFLTDPARGELAYPLSLGQCTACGLVQLLDHPRASEVRPLFEWIRYNEPEDHLDRMTDAIVSLPGLRADSIICGVTYKDDSTLRRLRERGWQNQWRVDPSSDLGISGHAELETIQEKLTPAAAVAMLDRYPRADVVLARHILEHAHDTRTFVKALTMLAKPSAYLVFESPDCRRAFHQLDYTAIWEEHILYFTPETFQRSFAYLDLEQEKFITYPYPFEDSLVGMTRIRTAAGGAPPDSTKALQKEITRGRRFADQLEKVSSQHREILSGVLAREGPIALLGAGHHACAYLNYLRLGDLVTLVADDNPAKAGLFMPGSRLPILPSEALLKRAIRLCLLGVSASGEENVLAGKRTFVEGGGRFASIFPMSRRALLPGGH